MLTKQRVITHANAAHQRPSGRSMTGWAFAVIGIWMAVSTAITTTDEGLRMMMVIAGAFLSGGLIVDVARWAVRRKVPRREE